MKRLFVIICVVCTVVSSAFPVFADDSPDPNRNAEVISVSAKSAALIDVQSGRILYEKNANQKMRIASLTKIITAAVAIESGHLGDVVTTSPRAARKEGSSIYLKAGEKQKLIDLVYAIMLRSGNDAATAIAEHIGGSEAKFAELMNLKMHLLGLRDSHFQNPHGLDVKNHFSTAHDMAVVTADALRHPIFAEVVKTRFKTIPWPGEKWQRRMRNKNKMLERYPGADGVKTGYTQLAGRCLAASATRDGRQLAVVVLDDARDWDDCAKLMDYGFAKYKSVRVIAKGQSVGKVPGKHGSEDNIQLAASEDFHYPLKEGEASAIRVQVVVWKSADRSPANHKAVGVARIHLGDQVIGSVPLVAITPH